MARILFIDEHAVVAPPSPRSILASITDAREPSCCDLLDLPDLPGRLQERSRINGLAVQANLEMKMVACRPAGRTHAGDPITASHLLANFGAETGQMSIACHKAIAVGNFDHIAIAATLSNEADLACGSGKYRLAVAAGKVDTGMEGRMAVERITAITIRA